MADVSKIQLPDSSTVNIKDYRIPGVDSAPTSGSDNVVTSGGIYTALSAKAPLASPALTGTPTAPTASAGTNTTQIATTAFVTNAISNADLWETSTGTNSVKTKVSGGTARGVNSVVEGYLSETGGTYSTNTITVSSPSDAAGAYSHAEGLATIASGNGGSHSEGSYTLASGNNASHAEGFRTVASGAASHTEGIRATASSYAAHAEGIDTKATGNYSHAEGETTKASGYGSHAEGQECEANGWCSHAEGQFSVAAVSSSHAEGYISLAIGDASHAEGGNCWWDIESISGNANATSYTCIINKKPLDTVFSNLALNDFKNILANSYIKEDTISMKKRVKISSVTSAQITNNKLEIVLELEKTLSETALTSDPNYKILVVGAFGEYSHSESLSTALGENTHAEGRCNFAIGPNSHVEGEKTIALNDSEHAEGSFNVSNKTSSTYGNAGNTQHSIGIGDNENNRKNAFEVMQNGDTYLYGVGDYNGSNVTSASTLQDVISANTIQYYTNAEIDTIINENW